MEWVRGRPLQKMSPQRDHARLQTALVVALFPWAKGRGEVGTEWRFRVAPSGGQIRPLVPDISFVRGERLRGLSREELQIPLLAPDVAFEILSPGDRRDDVDDKIDVLLRAGTALVLVVDPEPRLVELHDASGKQILDESLALEHSALAGFRYPLADLFAELDLPR
jgi:Uma2 family endonuclease